jgi:1,4-dihydroxy-2-naphthoate octaprenyltransferase
MATRPRTLPAAVSAVMIGAAAAAADDRFSLFPALAALAGAILLQIGVNLANDYYDYQKGIDTDERLGPLRVTHSGLMTPQQVWRFMVGIFLAASASGLYLTAVAGWPILVIGCLSILAALAYSGGPYPLASHGLGDIAVFIFFGPVAVCGTYYVQALQVTGPTLWLSIPPGLLITAIIVVNNLRDIATDKKTGKYTLAAMLGPRSTRIEYLLLTAGAYCTLPIMLIKGVGSVWLLLPLLSLPAAVGNVIGIYRQRGTALNQVLARTAALTLVFCLMLSAGILL